MTTKEELSILSDVYLNLKSRKKVRKFQYVIYRANTWKAANQKKGPPESLMIPMEGFKGKFG